MPTQNRQHHSALALLLVTVLVVVGSPVAAARSTTSSLATAIPDLTAVRGAAGAATAPSPLDDGPDDVREQAMRSGVINGRRVVVPNANAAHAADAAQTDWTSRPTPAVPQPRPKAETTADKIQGVGSRSTEKSTVAWWKLTTPDKGEFAYAAQSNPSVMLQTCVGAKSQFRLIVRLTKVG